MAVIAYTSGLLGLANGSIAFANDACYAILLGNGYTPDLAHDTYSDVSAQEIGDVDYNPVALSGKSVAVVTTDDILYDCDDISFGTDVTIGARYLAIVKGSAASPQAADPLIFYNDFGSVRSSTDAQFIVRTTDGLYKLTVA